MRIKLLPASIANQIAAGEVIERPASVVKELLENALDAGAKHIQVEVQQGGFNRIKVIDDGQGIESDDLPLAIAAHATSKISSIADLLAIRSMGFRGEALASIASVSRLAIDSKPLAQPHAARLTMENSRMELRPVARNLGTTVEVCDLFYNTPVRKKFLKSAQIEFQAIETIVKRFALSALFTSITLKHNDKLILSLPRADCLQGELDRIKKLFGRPFMEQALPIDVIFGEVGLRGWVSGREYQRSQNDRQWIYINKRMVRDKLIHHAIMQAYDAVLHPGRYPACILYLTLPADSMDVNVHPAKNEVRFEQPRLIHDLISSELAKTLLGCQTSVLTEKKSLAVETQEEKVLYGKWYEGDTQKPALESVVLNQSFMIIYVKETPFLVDVEKLQRQKLTLHLRETPLPLPSRPLLVPVSFPIAAKNFLVFEQHKVQLQQFGIQLDMMGENQIIVRSIPLLLPQLNIKHLLVFLEEKRKEAIDWITLLLDCHVCNASMLDSGENRELTAYFQNLIEISQDSGWYSPLDAENCRSLLKKKSITYV